MLVNVATATKPIYRVLVLASHNRHMPDLQQLGDESDLAALVAAGPLHVDVLTGDVTEDEIAHALFDGRYDIFHASIHGDEDGIALTNEFLERDQLGEMLHVHGIKIAVIMSCESSDIAKRVAQAGVCCVIGTTVKITNEAAYAFCLKFYRYLYRDQDAERAFSYATKLIRAEWQKWFTLYLADTVCGSEATDPYVVVLERILRLEKAIEGYTARLEELIAEFRRSSQEGHEQITSAMLQLVGLFQSMMRK